VREAGDHQITVMVIDDDRITGETLETMLQEKGYGSGDWEVEENEARSDL